MAIEGFDYKAFAENMTAQAKELVPADMQDFEKEYIIKTLGNFTMLAGEALYNDTSLNITAEQAIFITQIIAEWSYHKSIDLVHSGILPQYWDSIMQKIAFTIFEVAKQAVLRKIPQEQLLQAVEHHVVKVYNQSIEELEQKGIINEEIKTRAESQSNIDAMAQQAQQQAMEEQQRRQEMEAAAQAKEQPSQAPSDKTAGSANYQIPVSSISNKDMKLMSLALVLKILSQDKVMTILNKFDSNDSLTISNYMNMANLESQIDSDLVVDCIKEIKEFLPAKRKLSKENILAALKQVYTTVPREKIEKIIKNERPIVKRFISKSYDGEYDSLPLKVAGVITEYIEESV